MSVPHENILDRRTLCGGRLAVTEALTVGAQDLTTRQTRVGHDSFAVRRLASSLLAEELRCERRSFTWGVLRCAEGCLRCGSIMGMEGIQVSLSHSRGLVAAAISRYPIGVDIERLGPRPQPAIAEGRPDFWREWTCREARWKAASPLLCGSRRSDEPRAEIVFHHEAAGFVVSVAAVRGA